MAFVKACGQLVLVGAIIYGTYLFGHMWELVFGLQGVE